MSTREFANLFNAALPRDVGLGEQLSAAFQRENSVGLLLESFADDTPRFAHQDGFNPAEYMTLPELQDQRHSSRMLSARSPEELDWLRQRAQRLQDLDAVIGGGPLPGMVAGLVAGVLDPINLVPLGWAMRGAQALRLTRGVIGQTAVAGAAGMALLEPFRYAADPFRNFGDTMLDLMVGGAFGAGIGVVAQAVTRGTSRARLAYEAAGLPPDDAARLARAGSDAYANAARVAAESDPLLTPAGQSTVGAQRAISDNLVVRNALRDELLTVAGPRYVERLVSFFGRAIPGFRLPGSGLVTSPFTTARRFAWSYDDPGILSRAAMQDMDDAALQRAFTKAQADGFSGTYEEFRQIAEAELSSGLPAAERGTWQTNRALLDAMADPLKDAMAAKTAELRQAGVIRTPEEFAEAVGQHMRFLEDPDAFGGVSPIAGNPALVSAADEMAKIWKQTIADPMLDYIKKSGIWADSPQTHESIMRELRGQYFPKVFDTEKIVADLPGFIREMESALADAVDIAQKRYNAHQAAVRAYESLNDEMAKWQQAARDVTAGPTVTLRQLADDLLAARAAVEDAAAEVRKSANASAREWVEQIADRRNAGGDIAPWEAALERQYIDAHAAYSRAATAYTAFRDARLDELTQAAKGRVPPPAVLTRPQAYADLERDRALLFGSDGSGVGLTSPEARRAEATKIANDLVTGDPHMQLQAGLRAYLKARQTDINPARFLPWLETNFMRAAERYVSTMARDLPLYQTYGTLKVTDVIARLNTEAAELIDAAQKRGDTAEVARLQRERQLAEDNITMLWAKARGTFDTPRTAGERRARNAATNVQSLAFMAHMGSGLLAQIADPTKAALGYGVRRVVQNTIESIRAGVLQTADGLTKEQLSKLATAMEHANQARTRALYDIAPVEEAGRFTQAVQKTTTVFSRLTLMPAWNDALRKIGVRLADDLLTENIGRLLSGQRVDNELAQVASIAGVNNQQLRAMAGYLQKYRSQVNPDAKLWDSNLEAWIFQDPDLGQAYRRLLHVTAQRMLVTPSALDSPIWTQKALGRLVVMFKRFVISSIPQLLVPWLQSPAGRKMETVLAGLVLGGASTMLRDLNRSGEIKERSATEWFFDAMDMSGLFSGLTEIDGTLDRLVPGLGVKRMLTGEDYTRMQERSWMHGPDTRRFSDLLGVTARMGSNALTVGAMPYTIWNTGNPTEYQVRATRELIPFQNHFLFRHGFDALEAAMGGRQRGVVLDFARGG